MALQMSDKGTQVLVDFGDELSGKHFPDKGGFFFANEVKIDKSWGSVVGVSPFTPCGKWRCIVQPSNSAKFPGQLRIVRMYPVEDTQCTQIVLGMNVLPHIREARAELAVKAFGERLWEYLDAALRENDLIDGKSARSALVSKIKGIGSSRLSVVLEKWKEIRGEIRWMIEGARIGLTRREVSAAMESFGNVDSFIDAVHNNPYLLLRIKMPWDAVDGWARLNDGKKEYATPTDPERIGGALYAAAAGAVNSGHMYLPLNLAITGVYGCIGALEYLAIPGYIPKPEDITNEINSDHPNGSIFDYLEFDTLAGEKIISTRELAFTERETAERIAEIISADVRIRFEYQDISPLLPQGITPSNDQVEAILGGLNNTFSIITGGPGTGKTSVVLATILEVFKKNAITFTLCAPTGKAAVRMSQATSYPAETIHSVFKIFLEKSKHEKLLTDALVIDEASMVDADMMRDVMNMISAGKRVILIGDVNQLPSVGPGEVLFQLINSGRIFVGRLTTVHRQEKDSGIALACKYVNEGNYQKFMEVCQSSTDIKVLSYHNEAQAKHVILSGYKRFVEKFGGDENVLALCVSHKGDAGRIVINSAIRDLRNPDRPKGPSQIAVAKGDRFIHTKNNRDIGMMNGEMGEVLHVATEQEYALAISSDNDEEVPPMIIVKVDGRDGEVIYGVSDVAQIEVGFAITVHKSQGSEAKGVIFVMPTTENLSLRQIVLTAISRARVNCLVVQIGNSLKKAIENEQRVRRYTLLGRLLNLELDAEKELGSWR